MEIGSYRVRAPHYLSSAGPWWQGTGRRGEPVLIHVRREVDPALLPRWDALVSLAQREGLCPVLEHFAHGGGSAVVMPWLGGPDLAVQLSAGPIAPRQSQRWARQILLGLATMHEAGLIHGDVCAANVVVVPAEVDSPPSSDPFAARLVGQTTLADAFLVDLLDGGRGENGTAGYAAPERGNGPTNGADMWSWGRLVRAMGIDVPVVQQCLDADPKARPSAAEALMQWDQWWEQEASGTQVGQQNSVATAAEQNQCDQAPGEPEQAKPQRLMDQWSYSKQWRDRAVAAPTIRPAPPTRQQCRSTKSWSRRARTVVAAAAAVAAVAMLGYAWLQSPPSPASAWDRPQVPPAATSAGASPNPIGPGTPECANDGQVEQVVTSLLAARNEAIEKRDTPGLLKTSVTNSPIRAQDEQLLNRLSASGEYRKGLRSQILDLRVTSCVGEELEVDFDVQQLEHEKCDDAGCVPVPAQPARSLHLTLVRSPWRVKDVKSGRPGN